ncbi:MAG: TonB-dependent receptor [Bacteroidota bacterium]|nr:TonB-dependent receptor [Bacteroidota bacterium]
MEGIVKDANTGAPLVGVNIMLDKTGLGGVSDARGLFNISGISNGRYILIFSSIGFETLKMTYSFPLQDVGPIEILLTPRHTELEQVVVSAMRGSRNIDDIPTRVEVITSEELGEKAAMNSSNIAMILRESTGILIQQTSANSANASIRVQGLDGRYTQILRDGFPLYSGFSSGLSIMQVPPLDLAQVEVIKGSSSTLYGGGAIAGLVNLVSKVPEDEPELSFMVNQTSALGTTLNGFYAEKSGKRGITVYAAANHQTPYDPNGDGFSAIPKIRSISLNPKIFYDFAKGAALSFGINATIENRTGGDMRVLEGNLDPDYYFTESNYSNRLSSQFYFSKKVNRTSRIVLKNSVSFFDRDIITPSYKFAGKQWASFSEATYSLDKKNADWIIGTNVYTDLFREEKLSSLPGRDYNNYTFGLFAQNNWQLYQNVILESGMRADFNNTYGNFFLPRLSALYKINPQISTRLGGGMGYKIPTIFTEEAERMIFQNILPLNPQNIEAEKSIGGNFDVNYKASIGEEFFISINQLFFYTHLSNSLVLNTPDQRGFISIKNADGTVTSAGFETNMKLSYKDVNLFLNYALINASLNYNNINQQKPLTPKHNAGATLMYETERWRIGYEIYYTGKQILSNLYKTPDFWMMGFMVMYSVNNFNFFINFENFTDVRQSHYQPMVFGPINKPQFPEIWAPTEGFVTNGGVKIDLFWK